MAIKKNYDTSRFTFFWMTNRSYGEFSNWYRSDFTIEGITYRYVEQYMMAKKALLFKDLESYAIIMNAADPDSIKKQGRLVKNFDPALWDRAKEEIVYNGAYAKFSQNPNLKEKLLSTGDTIIAEASPKDGIWGIRLSESDPDAQNPDKWQGKNLLGKVLMRVREDLKA